MIGGADGALRQGEYRYGAPRALSVMPPRLKQLAPPGPLRVLRISDLEPGGASVSTIGAVRPLRDNAFEIVLTRNVEEIDPTALDLLDQPNP